MYVKKNNLSNLFYSGFLFFRPAAVFFANSLVIFSTNGPATASVVDWPMVTLP